MRGVEALRSPRPTVFAFDRYKGIAGDCIELEAAEAKQLQNQGLVSVVPAADRFKCGPEEITGWRPWAKDYLAASTDWEGKTDLTIFDDCMVKISYLGIGAIQLCAGLLLSAANEPIYFPFGAIRRSQYHCEDDPGQLGVIRVYLDEFARALEGEEITP